MDRDFSFFIGYFQKKVNIKLFLVVFSHIVLFRFEAKYKPDLKLNLDMDPEPKKKEKVEPGSGSRSSLDDTLIQTFIHKSHCIPSRYLVPSIDLTSHKIHSIFKENSLNNDNKNK
jgi:hypothetical protein